MELIEKKIIENVRRKRLEMNFTIQEISAIISVSQNFINNVESTNSHHKYNIVHLSKLAFLFDCKITDFFPSMSKYFDEKELQGLEVIKKQIQNQKKQRMLKRR